MFVRWIRHLYRFAIVFVGALSVTPGLATETNTTLHWNAPPGCPTETDFQRRVAEYLGPVTSSARAQTVADVVVGVQSTSFHVTVRIDQHGQKRLRVLDTVSCAEALNASSFIVAFAIDPNVVAREPRTSPILDSTETTSLPVGPDSVCDCQCPESVEASLEPSVETSVNTACLSSVGASSIRPPNVVAPQTQDLLPKTVSRKRDIRFFVHQATEVSFRKFPGPALGLGLGAALEYSQLRLFFSALTADDNMRASSRSGGTFRITEGRMGSCYLFSEPLSIGPCATLSAGAMTAEGYGVDVPKGFTKLWLSGSVGGMLRYAHGDNAEVGLYANAELPITRPYFSLDGEFIYRPPAAGFVGGLFIGLRFGSR